MCVCVCAARVRHRGVPTVSPAALNDYMSMQSSQACEDSPRASSDAGSDGYLSPAIHTSPLLDLPDNIDDTLDFDAFTDALLRSSSVCDDLALDAVSLEAHHAARAHAAPLCPPVRSIGVHSLVPDGAAVSAGVAACVPVLPVAISHPLLFAEEPARSPPAVVRLCTHEVRSLVSDLLHTPFTACCSLVAPVQECNHAPSSVSGIAVPALSRADAGHVRLADLRVSVQSVLGETTPLDSWCFTGVFRCGGADRLVKLLPAAVFAPFTVAQLQQLPEPLVVGPRDPAVLWVHELMLFARCFAE